jgi:hypothetical protein|tara:strand:- start:251 stop:496 length:246 start_codon:yes stop_codon:yes gene_type:complete
MSNKVKNITIKKLPVSVYRSLLDRIMCSRLEDGTGTGDHITFEVNNKKVTGQSLAEEFELMEDLKKIKWCFDLNLKLTLKA